MLEIHQRGHCNTREHPHSPVHYCEKKSRSLISCLTRGIVLAPRGRCSVLTLGVQCHCEHWSISCLISNIISCSWIELNWLNSPVNILKPGLGMICLLSEKSVKEDGMNSAWRVAIPFHWLEGTVGELSPKTKGTLSQLWRFLGWISKVRWHIQCSFLCNCTRITAQISPGYPEWFLPNVISKQLGVTTGTYLH